MLWLEHSPVYVLLKEKGDFWCLEVLKAKLTMHRGSMLSPLFYSYGYNATVFEGEGVFSQDNLVLMSEPHQPGLIYK